jgi:bifunctional DNA-binding transcriptional regulator/antitoxin component of YhaV-PrlF toxin-antitoxin module
MKVATVQARGQVTVPREIREANGINPGTELYFEQLGPGRFECRVLPARQSLSHVADRFSVDGVAPDVSHLLEEMGDEIAHRQTDRFQSETEEDV